MIKRKAPSPAMAVAIVALVFAVAGTAMAGIATVSVLSKKEKKQTRNIAKDEINKAAPGLSVANAANAQNANTANTALNADKLDGANLCRTNGVLTIDTDDPRPTLCTEGALSIQAACQQVGMMTFADLSVITTAAGTFVRSPFQTFQSIGPATVTIVHVEGGGAGAISTGTGDFSAGVPSTSDQLNGVATVRARATSPTTGVCDFTVGATS